MADQDLNLYRVVSERREQEAQPYCRLLYSGYFNEQSVQKTKVQIENFLTEQTRYVKGINGYLYLKGLFYLHLIQSDNPVQINNYMATVLQKHLKQPTLHHNIHILYQSFQNSQKYFKNWMCENIFQTGPTLQESQKSEQQIQERVYEIYSRICEGAKKKLSDPNTKIANECPLNMDDMCMMTNGSLMSIEEYGELYLEEMVMNPDSEEQFPMRPSVLQYMEFLEIDDYRNYKH